MFSSQEWRRVRSLVRDRLVVVESTMRRSDYPNVMRMYEAELLELTNALKVLDENRPREKDSL